MTSLREIYTWINRYDDTDGLEFYRCRRSFFSQSTRFLFNQMHSLIGGTDVDRVWDMSRHLLNLCNRSISYSANERAEMLMECSFIIAGLGNSLEAATLFAKAATAYGANLHNEGIALWGEGLNLWRIASERERAVIVWRSAINSFQECLIDLDAALLGRQGWYVDTIEQMEQALLQQLVQNGL